MKLKYRFFTGYLDKGERIMHVAHKHVLVLKLKSAKTSFFGVILPIIGYFLFPPLILVFIVWFLVGCVGLLYHYFDWYFDVWLLTNVGVIDIERDGFFTLTSTRVDYHMVEGISYTITGFWQTVFNYGAITVDKLGAKTSVMLADAANPKRLERLVMKYQERFIASKSVRDHQELKNILSEMIAYHVHNNKLDKSSSREQSNND